MFDSAARVLSIKVKRGDRKKNGTAPKAGAIFVVLVT